MDKIHKLSEAIRYGSTFLGECPAFCNPALDCGCALGTAYLATINSNPTYDEICQKIMSALSQRYDVPEDVLEDVSFMHFKRQKNRAECADWLEARGY